MLAFIFVFTKQLIFMKKVLAILFILISFNKELLAQDEIRPAAIGISFTLHDFATAQRIRSTSLSAVFRNEQWADFKEMSPGIAITYFKGLRKHIDFAGTLNGSFLDYPLPNKAAQGDNFLLEADASLNLKMFSEKYWFTPYLSVGVGASKYKGYWGAFLPLGGGIKVNFFDEASLFINTQYRVPVTNETSSYHFMNSIGISGVIGNKKK
jgi:OmpA-OmpF porin, OOP family